MLVPEAPSEWMTIQKSRGGVAVVFVKISWSGGKERPIKRFLKAGGLPQYRLSYGSPLRGGQLSQNAGSSLTVSAAGSLNVAASPSLSTAAGSQSATEVRPQVLFGPLGSDQQAWLTSKICWQLVIAQDPPTITKHGNKFVTECSIIVGAFLREGGFLGGRIDHSTPHNF